MDGILLPYGSSEHLKSSLGCSMRRARMFSHEEYFQYFYITSEQFTMVITVEKPSAQTKKATQEALV